MKNPDIKLISIDLFQTLVRLDDEREQIWKVFLNDRYSPELARRYWDRTGDVLLKVLSETAGLTGNFKNTRTMMEESYDVVFKEINCSFPPSQAASLLIELHKHNSPYSDALPFLQAAGKKHPVCLSTDCDTEMITGIRELYPFDKLFVSQELKAYKLNPAFFDRIIGHYRLNPENILHIGDSQSDILVPKKLGIFTCWLNRDSRRWQHPVAPDYEVKSLMDVLDWL
jgi:FMN phosphatase YigB (HAD superfamily)